MNFRANGAAITVLESMHYYPFGMLMEGIGTNTPTNDYTYNYKELNEDFGLNLYDYGARWYDASLGRWWSVDPMAEKYGRWSGYNYGLCNPVKFIDPDGRSVTTDYYNEKGSKLGTDGNDNGKMVVVTDKKEAKSIKKTDEAGGTTAEGDVKSGVELPSAYVRGEMGKALERAGNPSNHEEGGFWGLDENGNEFVSHAKPGAPADPSKDDKAQVNVFTPADISDLDKVAVIVGSFHTHPNGTVIEGGLDFNKIGGATKTSSWGNEPSSDDLANAKENRQGVTGNRYVLAQGNNTVYIYNGDGVKATFPLKQFIPEKK